MSQENKKVVRRYFEDVWNTGDYETLAEIVDEGYRGHDPAVDDVEGLEGLERQMQLLRGAFPDLTFTIEDQVAEGDLVATRWRASATHEGYFLGIPPTRRTATISGMTMSRLANRRIVEGWLERDTIGIMKSLAPENFLEALFGLVSGEITKLAGEGTAPSPRS